VLTRTDGSGSFSSCLRQEIFASQSILKVKHKVGKVMRHDDLVLSQRLNSEAINDAVLERLRRQRCQTCR
jgi:hypothetical protein